MAEIIFEAVTQNNKETDISKVKVRRKLNLTEEARTIIEDEVPEFKTASKMYRLELIDEQIIEQQDISTTALAKVEELVELRAKVETVAKTVKLV